MEHMHRVESLLTGGASADDWLNIQDIVRTSFRALLDLLKQQGESIRQLERRLEEKASWADVNSALEQKAGIADVNHSLTTLTHEVDSKCSSAEARDLLEQGRREARAEAEADRGAWQMQLARLGGDVQRKLDAEAADRFAVRDDVQRGFDAKVGRDEVIERLERGDDAVSRKLGEVVSRDELEVALRAKASVVEVDQVLKGKVDVDSMVAAVKSKASRHEVAELVDESLAEMKRQIMLEVRRAAADSGQANMADIITLLDQKANAADVHVILGGKVDRDEFVSVANDKVGLGELEERLAATTRALAAEVKQTMLTSQQEIVSILNKKAYKSDVQRSLATKASAADVAGALQAIATADGRATQGLREVETVRRLVDAKADTAALDAVDRRVKSLPAVAPAEGGPAAEQTRRELAQKVNVKDMCQLLDMKSNIQDVNQALEEVNKELERRALTDDLQRFSDDLQIVSQQTTAELSGGRWIWKTGKVTSTQTVPWNIQCINTNPDNFIWSKNSDTFVAVIPGLYQVSIGFFTDATPSVHLLVNGEPVLASINHPHDKVGAPGASSVRRGRHSAGNVTGWTAIEFLALPARAQLSVTYEGEQNAQGFFGLRKL